MTESSALGANGLLKDASEIDFYESESDLLPIGSKRAAETSAAGASFFLYASQRPNYPTAVTSSLGRGQRSANPSNRLLDALDAEKCNSDGEMIDESAPAKKIRVKHRKKRVKRVANGVDSDPEDENFEDGESASESTSDSGDEEDAELEKDVPNSEVCKAHLDIQFTRIDSSLLSSLIFCRPRYSRSPDAAHPRESGYPLGLQSPKRKIKTVPVTSPNVQSHRFTGQFSRDPHPKHQLATRQVIRVVVSPKMCVCLQLRNPLFH